MTDVASGSGGADALLGREFEGKYRILSVLGEGGMGRVYEAMHIEMERIVAIKTLVQGAVHDETSFLRFKQEAKTAFSLSHPNIVAIHDFGRSADGLAYLVMEHLKGSTLADEKNVLSPSRFYRIFSQVCDGMQHAHKHGIIHRDIKPSNLMIVKDDELQERVKIVDFGLAKLCGAEQSRLQLTQTGLVVGSPSYMSPEQCKGEELDARSDIYSLGCVMYETLAGKVPFLGANPMSTIYKHITDSAQPLSELLPALKSFPKLEPLIMSMLEKDPGCRPQTMAELRRELSLALSERDSAAANRQTMENPTGTRPMVRVDTAVFSNAAAAISELAPANGAVAAAAVSSGLRLEPAQEAELAVGPLAASEKPDTGKLPVPQDSGSGQGAARPKLPWLLGALASAMLVLCLIFARSSFDKPAGLTEPPPQAVSGRQARVRSVSPGDTKVNEQLKDVESAGTEQRMPSTLALMPVKPAGSDKRVSKPLKNESGNARVVSDAEAKNRQLAALAEKEKLQIKRLEACKRADEYNEQALAAVNSKDFERARHLFELCLRQQRIGLGAYDPHLVKTLSSILSCSSSMNQHLDDQNYPKQELDLALRIIEEKTDKTVQIVSENEKPSVIWRHLAYPCLYLSKHGPAQQRQAYQAWSIFLFEKARAAWEGPKNEYYQKMMDTLSDIKHGSQRQEGAGLKGAWRNRKR